LPHRHVLWTDDLVAAELARQEFACRRVWTQFVFTYFTAKGSIDATACESLTAQLMAMEYYYTKPTVATVMHAFEEAEGDVDKAPLAQVLDWFGDPNVRLEGQYFICCGSIKGIWQKCAIESTAQQATIRILDRLSQRPGGFKVIDGLLESIERIFNVDVLNAQNAKETIIGWRKGRGTRIILP